MGRKHCGEKGENTGYQHFLSFPQCFLKPPCLGSLKVRIVWDRIIQNCKGLTLYHTVPSFNDP